MKREKEGEITDTADTSKTQREETQQHKQHSEQDQQNVLWDYALGPLPALKCNSFHPGTVWGLFFFFCKKSTQIVSINQKSCHVFPEIYFFARNTVSVCKATSTDEELQARLLARSCEKKSWME